MGERHPIMEQIGRFEHLVRRYYGHGHHGHGQRSPHRGQGRVLKILGLHEEISQKELAYLLDLRKQSLGELLAKLEAKGYISRQPSPKDKRVMNVRLTESGREAAKSMEQSVQERKDIFEVLSEAEQQQFSESLDKLIKVLERETEESDLTFHRGSGHHHGGNHRRGGHHEHGGRYHSDEYSLHMQKKMAQDVRGMYREHSHGDSSGICRECVTEYCPRYEYRKDAEEQKEDKN